MSEYNKNKNKNKNVDSFREAFHDRLRLGWPELNKYNEFIQTSNPSKEATVTGFQGFEV